jgi:thiamine pyrophosphokinase
LPDETQSTLQRGVIFANGDLNLPTAAESLIRAGDLVIAADGGLLHCRQLGMVPDVLIGDFDSISEQDRAELEASGAEIIRHPARKDYTDLELALRYAQARGLSEILVLGALGARWDQTLANLLLPAAVELNAMDIHLLDGEQEIQLLRGAPSGRELMLRGQPGEIVSLIPLGGDAQGITTRGLEYPLHNGSLSFGATRGVSNSLVESTATIRLESGLLLCVIVHTG